MMLNHQGEQELSIQERSSQSSSMNKQYTITSEGYIPSYNYKDRIQCPVKVAPDTRSSDKFPNPVRTETGRLIFMLPGGIEIAPDVTTKIIEFTEANGIERRGL